MKVNLKSLCFLIFCSSKYVTFYSVKNTEGFVCVVDTGVELRTWLWKNMKMSGFDAESTLSELLRVGFLECLTPDSPANPFDDQQYYRLVNRNAEKRSDFTSYKILRKTASL